MDENSLSVNNERRIAIVNFEDNKEIFDLKKNFAIPKKNTFCYDLDMF